MNILVAVDGSPQSVDAVRALAHFAPPDSLTLIHGMSLPNIDHPMIMPEARDEVMRTIEAQLRERGAAALHEARQALPDDSVTPQEVLEPGNPAHVILHAADRMHVDLIVTGARGMGAWQELVLGSVSHRVALHASCSTLVVKQPLPALRSILIPIEGGEDAQAIFHVLAAKPFRQPVEIQLLMVWPQPQVPWPITLGNSEQLEQHAIKYAQEQLDALTAQLGTMGYPATGVVGMGDPSYAILEHQRQTGNDLIVMGSHGRRGLSRFLLGSVSHTVLHQAGCSVLIVRETPSSDKTAV